MWEVATVNMRSNEAATITDWVRADGVDQLHMVSTKACKVLQILCKASIGMDASCVKATWVP